MGRGAILTVTDLRTVPPGPVQSSMYVVFAVKGPVEWLPNKPGAPVKPSCHSQELALVELQLIVEEFPDAIGFGEALSERSGAGGGGAV